jgi:two-component system nitrogen regulation response regulator GlnG
MTQHFFKYYAQELGKDFVSIADETMQRFVRHDWPGNVRELQGVIKQTLLKASGPVISPAFLPSTFGATPSAELSNDDYSTWHDGLRDEVASRFAQGSHRINDEIHDQVDAIIIRQVLKATSGNISESSSRLGVSRPTLRNRIKQLRLDEPS